MDDMALQVFLSIAPSIGAALLVVWRLGYKISIIDMKFRELGNKIGDVDKDIITMKQDIKEELTNAREGRKNMWGEVNSLRERTTVIETRMDT